MKSILITLLLAVSAQAIAFKDDAAGAPPAPKQEKVAVKEIPADQMPKNLQRPLKVGVTFILNSILNLNEKSGEFEAEVDLTLNWTDPDLAFSPVKAGTTILALNEKETQAKLKSIWYPKITLANIAKIVKNTPSMRISSEGEVSYVQRIKAVFVMNPNLKAFPFDTQNLTVFLDANENDTSEIRFNQDQTEIDHSGIREGVKLPGWTMERVDFKKSIIRSSTGSFYPRFEVMIIMKRVSTAHLFAFAPLLIIILAPTILTLYSDTAVGPRLTAWGASLLTLIATSFALNQKYPALEADSILPQLINILLVYQFVMIICTFTVLDKKFAQSFKNPYVGPEIVSVLRWAIPTTFILAIFTAILLVSSAA